MRVPVLILLAALAASAEEPATPTRHPATGVWFPTHLAGLPLSSLDPANSPDQPTGYVFSHPVRPINASLYITKIADPPQPAELENRVRFELARSLVSIETLAENGRYENLHMGTVRRSHTDLDGTSLIVVDSSFTFSFPDEATKNLPAFTSIRSFIATTIYAGHLFKLRYTEPAGARWTGSQDPDKRATATVDAFVDLFREHALRPQVDKALEAYRTEPFSDQGLMAAAFLYTFADESALANIDLGQQVLDFVGYGSKSKPDPSATRHLLNAYVIGNFARQFESDTWTDQPDAGRQQVRQTYRQLRQRNADFTLPHLEPTIAE
ncbi:MAG: hypothetical protein P8J87_02730 [Verrucomicrobiales bacterium]|nr:hypothetical protein [Verrucomicrobiales bacterium]